VRIGIQAVLALVAAALVLLIMLPALIVPR